MKKTLIYSLTILTLLTTGTGCKKFLALDPLSNLSGNNFWKTEADVDNYTNGLFELYRAATFRSNMKAEGGTDEFPLFAFSGDMRFAPVYEPSNSPWSRTYIQFLRTNNLNPIVRGTYNWTGGNNWANIFTTSRFMNWDRLFKVVAGANVLVAEVDEVTALTPEKKARYKAEGVFMRNMAYFTMVRLYGDVPYYTNAYNATALPRLPMVEVLNKCVADMAAYEQDLPWSYDDAARRAVRGMRGGALALLMHMKMWLASFDGGNATNHYTDAIKYGEELIKENKGAYELIPYTNRGFRAVFRGRSKEGLFEMPQNSNYGESFGWSFFSDHITRYRINATETRNTYLYYAQAYLDEIYPPGQPDIRRSEWYEDIYSTTGRFWLTKYSNIFQTENNSSYVDDSQIVFRLGESYLLLAEAYANASRTAEAIEALNVIRRRAAALEYTGQGGDDLKKAIWYERCKELIGEGHFSYDMIRTKNVLDPKLSFGNSISVEDYKNGAWTWPLSNAVRANNPTIILNNYWN
ncbi:RagB/SusD family nutrient uptake outer membrane protein [Paraflavitalea pollutisoli]|uniref:RagB/SusD family nutrient uptake outer membrane protein n=1 Tax=Paraflavitalea pollutisoli TaxID=3034143 RepID=UPI0023ED0550|nr:RagB/SusD family nutrient uptake outer membrane protein [Paraflavitalea sp. H1-2-19X]